MNDQLAQLKTWLGSGSINLFGRPFAGKDTQGRLLADDLGGVLISGGDILRAHHDQARLNAIMAAGEIIPSDMFLDMVVPYFSRPDFTDKPLILSEVGRLQHEAEVIKQAAEQSGHPLKAVVVLDLPETAVWQRFEAAKQLGDRGQRQDDRQEVLQERLDEYREKVLPVLDYYQQQGLLITIDGTLERENVTKALVDQLHHFAFD